MLWIHTTTAEVCSARFPHSEISGSMDICSSPKLFAAYHVFHRLLVPRHPPCALISLTRLTSAFAFGLRCIALHLLVFGFLLLIYLSVYPSDVLIFSSLKILSFLFNMWFSRYMLGAINSTIAPVGLSGLEPPTSRLSGVRSNRLSYKPFLYPAPTCSPISSPI